MATDLGTFSWPGSGAGSGSNASVGLNGQPIPLSSTLIAAENPSLNQTPLQADASGNLLVSLAASPASPLHVIVDSSALPTGASTSALQTTGNTSVASIDTKTPTVGQKAMAASSPVVIASDQSALTVSLPTGASTSALQTTGNTSLASIDTKTPALGAAAIAASVPVTIATDQLPVANTSILYSSITNANYDITCAGYSTVMIQSIGGFSTGTFTIRGSTDGTNFNNIPGCFNLVNQSTGAVYTNVSILLNVPCGGFKVVRCVASSVTGGPPNLQMIAAVGTNMANVYCPSAAQFLVTSNIKDSLGNNLLQGQQTMANSLGVTIASNQSNLPTNVAQINAVTPLMGNGVTGTGSQRVTIASDNTAFTVNSQVVPQSSSTNANSSAASTALASSLVIKAGAGRLFQLTGVNTKASAQYIQVFNNTSAPADTTVPILLAYVPAASNFSFDFGEIGRYFSTGITVTNSSTAATKTIGSADCWFNAEYL